MFFQERWFFYGITMKKSFTNNSNHVFVLEVFPFIYFLHTDFKKSPSSQIFFFFREIKSSILMCLLQTFRRNLEMCSDLTKDREGQRSRLKLK